MRRRDTGRQGDPWDCVVCEEHIQGLERRAVFMYDYVSQGLIYGMRWLKAEIWRDPPHAQINRSVLGEFHVCEQ